MRPASYLVPGNQRQGCDLCSQCPHAPPPRPRRPLPQPPGISKAADCSQCCLSHLSFTDVTAGPAAWPCHLPGTAPGKVGNKQHPHPPLSPQVLQPFVGICSCWSLSPLSSSRCAWIFWVSGFSFSPPTSLTAPPAPSPTPVPGHHLLPPCDP